MKHTHVGITVEGAAKLYGSISDYHGKPLCTVRFDDSNTGQISISFDHDIDAFVQFCTAHLIPVEDRRKGKDAA